MSAEYYIALSIGFLILPFGVETLEPRSPILG